MKINEAIYMVLDEIKAHSDDSDITEEHALFLLKKYRSALLKKQYLSKTDNTPSSNNTQTICIELEDKEGINDCMPTIKKSRARIPNLLFEQSLRVYPINYNLGVNFCLVPKERFPFVGYNKYLKSIVYCYIEDHYLYFDSSRPQTQYLKQVMASGVFEDIDKAAEMSCSNNEDNCDPMQQEFPIEDSMVPELIQLVVKELLGVAYRPADTMNDANDNLSALARFLANNTKSDLAKKLDGTAE